MHRPSEPTLYRWTKRVLITLAAIYLAIIFETERVMGRPETYPFAAWSLFSMVPNVSEDFSALLVEVDGRRLEPPVYFERAWALLSRARHHNAWMAMQGLGHAMEQRDTLAVDEARRRFEELYFDGKHVVYEMTYRRYDPMELWLQGKYRAIEALPRVKGRVAP